MKIASYNVNGIRAAIKKDLLQWLKNAELDVLALQEVKANRAQVDMSEFHALGYKDYWFSAEKKGYSGVAILTRIEPNDVQYGMDIPQFDIEGRYIEMQFANFNLINCYFPSGTSGTHRQDVKYQFLDDIYGAIIPRLQNGEKIILSGDYNIAHTEMDIHDPKRNQNTSGFLPEERAWMTKWLENGMIDAYRCCHPDEISYSWWSYRAGARARNKGWRIDYHCLSDNLKPMLKDAYQDGQAKQSDHCPVILELED